MSTEVTQPLSTDTQPLVITENLTKNDDLEELLSNSDSVKKCYYSFTFIFVYLGFFTWIDFTSNSYIGRSNSVVRDRKKT